MSNDFPPTTIVLAKVKGYPAWPAMVLDEELLPEHISSKKPKSRKAASNFLPVRFFSDDTYIWINITDVKLLAPEMIDAHFVESSTKRRKDNLLENAFELAKEPPEMELFIQYGSRAAPPDEEEVAPILDEEDVIVAKPARKKAKVEKKPAEKKPVEKKLSAKEKQRLQDLKIWAGYDSDWGLDDFNQYDFENGNYIFDNEEEQNEIFNNIDFDNLDKLTTKFAKIEEKLISKILKDGIYSENDKEVILYQLHLLNTLLKELPRSIINKSKLLRVLILNQRRLPKGELEKFKKEHEEAQQQESVENGSKEENEDEDVQEVKEEVVKEEEVKEDEKEEEEIDPEVFEANEQFKEELRLKIDSILKQLDIEIRQNRPEELIIKKEIPQSSTQTPIPSTPLPESSGDKSENKENIIQNGSKEVVTKQEPEFDKTEHISASTTNDNKAKHETAINNDL
ncbi:unnamed protein product [Candida verbasci]|uniref:PWWP domain-containing protein n=1 Tax=Candida verbasci TaxID=1227364 RepID=A0A9W4U036_9ASCO|nr:unnamed protein product [Candida verbasci]